MHHWMQTWEKNRCNIVFNTRYKPKHKKDIKWDATLGANMDVKKDVKHDGTLGANLDEKNM